MSNPDHKDAELILKLYDLRREIVMRASRETINNEFCPTSFDEVKAINDFEDPRNAAFRQVTSYWEMAFGFGARGIVHPEFLVENCGEGLFVFSKIEPYLEQFRQDFWPEAFKYAEWAATKTETGKTYMEMFRAYREQAAAT